MCALLCIQSAQAHVSCRAEFDKGEATKIIEFRVPDYRKNKKQNHVQVYIYIYVERQLEIFARESENSFSPRHTHTHTCTAHFRTFAQSIHATRVVRHVRGIDVVACAPPLRSSLAAPICVRLLATRLINPSQKQRESFFKDIHSISRTIIIIYIYSFARLAYRYMLCTVGGSEIALLSAIFTVCRRVRNFHTFVKKTGRGTRTIASSMENKIKQNARRDDNTAGASALAHVATYQEG